MTEGGAQDLRQCEDDMPVRDGADQPVAEEFGPERRALGGARRAETPLLARKGDEVFVAARVAPDPREAAFGETADSRISRFTRLRASILRYFSAVSRKVLPIGPLVIMMVSGGAGRTNQ
jgi:hypothetical protein